MTDNRTSGVSANGEVERVVIAANGDKPPRRAVLVAEGWWHPNVKSGVVHDHPQRPNGNWFPAHHRECEPVYMMRSPASRDEFDDLDFDVREHVHAVVADRLSATHLAVGTAVLRSIVDATLDATTSGMWE